MATGLCAGAARGRLALYLDPHPNPNPNPDPNPDPNVQALLEAVRRPAAEMARYRSEMKRAARRRFSWAAVAGQWDARFTSAAEGEAGGSGGGDGGDGGGGGGKGGDKAQRSESGGEGQRAGGKGGEGHRAEPAVVPPSTPSPAPSPSPSRARPRRKVAAVFVSSDLEVGLGGDTGRGDGAPYNPAVDAPELFAQYQELHARRTQLQAKVRGLEEEKRRLVLDAST